MGKEEEEERKAERKMERPNITYMNAYLQAFKLSLCVHIFLYLQYVYEFNQDKR